ncbi:MAG: hypothetical protein NXI17_03240 [Alphaproteobacteria bacterium]|nr:hypothetical protein [Alphaproteobacteria bacterium]
MDPTDHNDGQKVAFEYRTDVAMPEPILASLASHFDGGEISEPFSISAFPITQSRSFSKFAEQNAGTITSITYDVAVPNMFNNPGDFTDEMKVLRDKGNVSRVKTELKSDGALDTAGSNLNEIAEHVEKGGGRITAKTMDGGRYQSDDYLVTEEIDTGQAETETGSFWQKIAVAIDRIF